MLAETDIVEAVAERLQRYQIQNVVLDTVMLCGKSGDPLLSPSGSCHATQSIITTGFINNAKLARSSRLARRAPHARTEQEMLEQGRSLLAMGCGAVLMKVVIWMMSKAGLAVYPRG